MSGNISIPVTIQSRADGHYWTFEDPAEVAAVWLGPFETHDDAIADATKALENAYAKAVANVFGDDN